jgi:hypothetical protein
VKNKKIESILLIFSGLVITGSGLFIYFIVDTIYTNSGSSRVQQLNWLLRNLGRTPTALLICLAGLIPLYAGIRKWRRNG